MDLVPGWDLQRLVWAGRRKQPLPYGVGPSHTDSLRAFRRRLQAADRAVSEVNLGDFMLTPDGRVVPLDMYVVVPRLEDPFRGLHFDGIPIEFFMEELY